MVYNFRTLRGESSQNGNAWLYSNLHCHRFKGWYDTARSVEPSEQYTDTKETLSKVPDYSFLEIGEPVGCGFLDIPNIATQKTL